MGGALDPAVATGRNLARAALADLGPGSRIVVAVSGGADSLALAAVTAFVAEREAYELSGMVVDHQLQDGSAAVAARAAEQLAGLGIPSEVVAVDVGTAGGPEASARRARYAALERTAAEAILLAHTLDDQAETVLLGLGRGSGPRSIAGMSPVDGVLRRPFLTLRRVDTERICQAYGLQWWTDPHNSDPGYRRSRLRAELMPLLEDVLGGGVAEALARTADQVRSDSLYLDDAAAAVELPLDVPTLTDLHPALRSRVLRRGALEAGADGSALTAAHLAALDRLVTDWHGQVRIELPGGIACVREGDSLSYVRTPVGG
ncbi:tRNA lysidine(34) synthetase TilS [Aeromicrobium ginsengisoli]|uniref:tRNA(Ile)-lysidine synthase n=1 Tax=Aeromicrobium ginsengisoli TaxID=363867 RepID=A0A5M4FD10_9ACTN|nr:tRNA lysidine(34) synthetase TilS [Aeromicrobium ginsengisoli]KAA1397139.1 tRNA lysidine(34) synthetase TilS [Aeromicrobium ginsengisoli]